MMARIVKTFGPSTSATKLRATETLLPISDYLGRDGFDPLLVDPKTPLPLPGPGRWANDLVKLKTDAREAGRDDFEIRYTHFSVKMSKSRALPLFSACVIDGGQSDRGVERTDTWRRDPRIDAHLQNLKQAYGDENKGLFSRGHMTRREDPNWGDAETARQADADTFTIPNVAPQRQGFNGGIWLDLENYVLDNTDRENLKIAVITGPVLADNDPTYYQIKVPVAFWKVIAFTNALSRSLTVISYKRSQLTFLPTARGARFVFGDFEDTQVSVASVEADTGLDLAAYRSFDVMAQADVSMAVRLSGVTDVYLNR
jgi:endonuclease G, mitochondrial